MDAVGVFSALALGGSFGGLVGIGGGIGLARMIGGEVENLIIVGGAAGMAMGGAAGAGGAIGTMVNAPPPIQNAPETEQQQQSAYSV